MYMQVTISYTIKSLLLEVKWVFKNQYFQMIGLKLN